LDAVNSESASRYFLMDKCVSRWVQRLGGMLNTHVTRRRWVSIREVAKAPGVVYNTESVVALALLATVESASVVPCRASS